MINYEKLREAYYLASNIQDSDGFKPLITTKLRCPTENILDAYLEIDLDFKGHYRFYDLKELINKLRELTQPKPKYAIGQEVWGGYKKPLKFIVRDTDGSEYWVKDDRKDWSSTFMEDELYPSREALIDAQIAYWIDLRVDLKSEEISGGTLMDDGSKCEHESDGNPYCTNTWLGTKCKHCGEFYR